MQRHSFVQRICHRSHRRANILNLAQADHLSLFGCWLLRKGGFPISPFPSRATTETGYVTICRLCFSLPGTRCAIHLPGPWPVSQDLTEFGAHKAWWMNDLARWQNLIACGFRYDPSASAPPPVDPCNRRPPPKSWTDTSSFCVVRSPVISTYRATAHKRSPPKVRYVRRQVGPGGEDKPREPGRLAEYQFLTEGI